MVGERLPGAAAPAGPGLRVSLELLLKGVVLGFVMAIPVGPVALTCLRRSLAAGRRAGLICGLGAATADAFYALLGAYALKAVTRWLVREQSWLDISGGLILVLLGARIMRRRPIGQADSLPGAHGRLTSFLSTFLLAMANPLTFLVYAALFVGFDLVSGADYSAAAALSLGVFGGSTLWWLLLASIAEWLRPHIGGGLMQRINRWCGGALVAAGIFTLTGKMLARW